MVFYAESTFAVISAIRAKCGTESQRQSPKKPLTKDTFGFSGVLSTLSSCLVRSLRFWVKNKTETGFLPLNG